jgi:nitrate reductase gamma subunit
MNILYSLVAVVALTTVAYLGADAGMQVVFGQVFPYIAIALFLVGMIYRVIYWAKSPVPFRITTTCGQQKSLPWIKRSKFENPSSTSGVVVRMVLEVLFFRSLFRNTKAELDAKRPSKVVYASAYGLWFFSLLFHWSFFLILIRHMRFFLDPVPGFVLALQKADGFLEIGVPLLYLTGLFMVIGVLYLLLRRLYSAPLRYISLASDYFPLFLILAIGLTGIWLRYFAKTDVVGIKELALGIVLFRPEIPEGIGPLFYAHFFLVCCLMAYFPFSKLVHGAGVFFSPTRNMTGNSREVRHVNPWNDPNIKPHSYEDYENEFREKMKSAGIPVDKE